MIDQYGREIDYLRISITDRCNLRCRYCMPEDIELVGMKDILTYEEIQEAVSAAAGLGIRKIRITGGEPLVRKGCADLIRGLKEIPGIEQVTLTTNGVLLEKYLEDLVHAGLDAVNISLDTLDPKRFALITGRNDHAAVLAGIRAALASDLRVKINTVLQKGVNDDEWLLLACMAEKEKLDVRFIEMMPIGFGAVSRGVSNDELRAMLKERYPDMADDPSVHGSGPAVYVRIPGWTGSIGFISAVHGKFCSSCNRIRMSAAGVIKPCLCYESDISIRSILREGGTAEERKHKVQQVLADAIYHKPQAHCFEDMDRITEKQRMVKIGG